MKTQKVRKILVEYGWYPKRHGATTHEIWEGIHANDNRRAITVVHHEQKEINKATLAKIRRQTGIKKLRK